VRDATTNTIIGTSNAFAVVTAPIITVTGVTLSNNAILSTAAVGAAVGTISVAAVGGTFNGTLALSGVNAPSFKIVGNQLESAVTPLTVGTDAITITATP
jgi:hypothetical protein